MKENKISTYDAKIQYYLLMEGFAKKVGDIAKYYKDSSNLMHYKKALKDGLAIKGQYKKTDKGYELKNSIAKEVSNIKEVKDIIKSNKKELLKVKSEEDIPSTALEISAKGDLNISDICNGEIGNKLFNMLIDEKVKKKGKDKLKKEINELIDKSIKSD